MNKYDHVRSKAVELRVKGLSLDEIVERLALPRTTIYYWIKSVPTTKNFNQTDKSHRARIAAAASNTRRFKALRDQAYQKAWDRAKDTLSDPEYRDFTLIYLCEGFRRTRHRVAVANSNPNIISRCYPVFQKEAAHTLTFSLQRHEDQDEGELQTFWGSLLGIDPSSIRVIRKSNSGKLKGREWRSVHGVFTIHAGDTYFRSRVQAWMDFIEQEWSMKNLQGVAQLGGVMGLGPIGYRFDSGRPDCDNDNGFQLNSFEFTPLSDANGDGP